eukprot:2284925-Rhodomonas_salina.2
MHAGQLLAVLDRDRVGIVVLDLGAETGSEGLARDCFEGCRAPFHNLVSLVPRSLFHIPLQFADDLRGETKEFVEERKGCVWFSAEEGGLRCWREEEGERESGGGGLGRMRRRDGGGRERRRKRE